jgi:hypothetical protein
MNEEMPSDDQLLEWLNQFAVLSDPVPERLLAAAREAFSLRELDARVAELVHDSVVDTPAAPVPDLRSRMLSFESGDVAVECAVTAYASRRDIYGQLVGGNAQVVDAEVAGRAAVTVRVDANGCFGVRGLASGPVRLRCRLADGTTLVTSWAVILDPQSGYCDPQSGYCVGRLRYVRPEGVVQRNHPRSPACSRRQPGACLSR